MTNKVHSFRLLIAAAMLLSGPARAQDFPIGAWFAGMFHGDNTQWATRLDTVQATGFNTIHAALVDTQHSTARFNQEWMDLAHDRDLKVQLYSWRQPSGWRGASAFYWARTFEAEDPNLFSHDTGRQVTDGDRQVLHARVGDSAGLLLNTDGRAGAFRLRENSTARYGHYAFWLKTDNNTGTQHLGTLRVLRQSDGVVLDSLVVRRRHFSAVDTYEDFVLDSAVPAGSGGFRVRFQVHWTGSGNLWVDKVRAHDWDPDTPRERRRRSVRLFGGEFDSAIRDTLASYYGGTVDPPWRFYLYDEPRWELNEAVAYMDALIRTQTDGTPGVSAVNLRPDTRGDLRSHRELLRNHLNTVNPSELAVDYYVFSSRTAVPGGGNYARHLRDRLGLLKTLYGPPREVTLERNIPLWAIVQAHSWAGGLRDPTPEEIRAQVNLALAHGAKGIYYFMYPSLILGGPPANPNLAEGLVDLTFARTTKLTEVAALNAKLDSLAPTYLALASDTVFVGTAPTDFVHGLSATRGGTDDYFLGTFTHDDRSRYLMIVNEDLSTTPNRPVTVTLDVDELKGRDRAYQVLDVYGETRTPAPASTTHPDRVSFPVTLRPGDGRLYRIETVGTVTLAWDGGKVSATLQDPDEPSRPRNRERDWQWQRRRPADGSTWTDIPNATDNTFRPMQADDGHRLRVRVSYIDRAGHRKTAHSPETEAVMLPRVRFDAESYSAVEGGRPVGSSERPPVKAVVTVQLTPAPTGKVRIPIAVTPVGQTAAGDYRVSWPGKPDTLSLTPSKSSRSFTIEGLRDPDLADETVRFGFGTLPGTVVAGSPATATVTIHDTPNAPADLTPSPGDGRVRLQWTDPQNPAITGWQYRTKRGEKPWGGWTAMDNSGASTTEHPVPDLTNGRKYHFQVRAYNQDGYGAVSDTSATPNGLRATPYRAAVVLEWSDGGRADVTRWEYQVKRASKKKWGEWHPAGREVSPRRQTVRNLADGVEHDFRVRGFTAEDAVAVSWPKVKATPAATLELPPNEPPFQPEGPAAVSIPEDSTDTGADYTSTDPEGTTVTWSLTGDDADSLRISAQGRLSFRSAPDYEAPTDKDKDRIYRVSVVATDEDGLSSLPRPVAVTVDNVEEPGSVRIALPDDAPSPAGPPQVWQRLTATVSDPDGGVRNPQWQWQRQPFAGGPFVDMPKPKYARSASYVVQPADVCHRLRVKVTYEDNHGPDKPAQSPDDPLRVIDKPGAPAALSASAGDRLVTLTWGAAPGHCSAVTRYESRYSPKKNERGEWVDEWTDWATVAGEAGARSLEVSELANDTTYTLGVRAVNAAGEGVTAGVSATPRPPGLVVLGPDTTKVDERHTGVVDTFRVAEKGITWGPLGGADRARFTLTGEADPEAPGQVLGLVRFIKPPDYEAPDDHDRDRDFELEITAQKGTRRSDPHALVVVVRNINDPGFITLAPPRPRPGQTFWATLADADGGVDDLEWIWEGGREVRGVQGAQAPSLHAKEWEATSGDVGKQIRVKARYTDNHGLDSALAATQTILDKPGAPKNLTAARGNAQVTLKWDPAPDGGSAIEHYEWRRSRPPPGPAWTGWAEVEAPPGPPPEEPPRSVVAGGLSNGTAYTFEVRAENEIGDGLAASVTATPATVPGVPPNFQASPGHGQVRLTWGEATNGGDPIQHYETRYRRGDRSWTDSWSPVDGGKGARARTISPLTNGQPYVFQVRAENGPGEGPAAEKPATPKAPNRAPVVTGPATPSVVENDTTKVGTYTGTDPDAGDVLSWEPLGGDHAGSFELKELSPPQARKRELHFQSIPNHEVRERYSVEVIGRDRGGLADTLSVTVTVTDVNEAPEVRGPESPEVPEEAGKKVGTYTASDPDAGDELTWSLAGDDPSHFERKDLTPPQAGKQELHFQYVPDHEARDSYSVDVVVEDAGGLSDTVTVSVSVTDVDEPGSVTLTPSSPRVGQTVTAKLIDTDGGVSDDPAKTIWTWARVGSKDSPGGILGQQYSVRTAEEEVLPGDVGKHLRATVTYTDNHGPNKSATSTSEKIRANVPGTPGNLRASAGDRRVSLIWEPAAPRGAAVDSYQYRRRPGSSSWTTIPGGGGVRSRTVTNLLNGTEYTFFVRAHNGEGYGAPDSVKATPEAPPNRAPSVSGPATPSVAENGPLKVGTYTLSDPDAGDALSWAPLGGDHAGSFELKQLSPPQARKRELHFKSTPNHEARERYAVKVIGRDRAGLRDTLSVTVTVTDVNEAPTVSGPASASVREEGPRKVATYTASDPDAGDGLTWSVSEDRHFELKKPTTMPGSRRELHFKYVPDHESRSSYSVDVVVEDPDGLEERVTVSVTVTDIDEPGFVTLSPSSPRVNHTVTATLIDTDGGVTDTVWTWARVAAVSAQTPSIRTSKEKVVAGDVGSKLKATVSYTDNHGSGKGASATTSTVRPNKPGAVGSLTASGGDKRVTLRWTAAPANGATITAYRYRQGSSGSWLPAGNGAARSKTIGSLTNGQEYTFSLRAYNSEGAGPEKSASATPATVPGAPPSFSAARGDTEVTLRWSAADSNGSAITKYEYRRKTRSASRWGSWTNAGGKSARAKTITRLTNGTTYNFQLRAVNGVGGGAASSASATPAGRPGAPPNLTTDRPAVDAVAIYWDAADSNGSPITGYQYRRRAGSTGSWRGWFSLPSTSRSRKVTGLRPLVRYTWELRAVNGEGAGPTSSVVSQPRGIGGVSGQSEVEPQPGDNIGDNEGEPDTPMEDTTVVASAKPVAAGATAEVLTTCPNPFNAETTLRYHLAEDGPVTLTLFNVAGQVVAVLVDQVRPAGFHETVWEGTREASGIYLYRLVAGGKVHVGKLALIR